jgi:hypothetical protein
VRDGRVEVLDVQGDMVTADVAVARRLRALLPGLVLEDLEDGLAAESIEVQPPHEPVVGRVRVLAHP